MIRWFATLTAKSTTPRMQRKKQSKLKSTTSEPFATIDEAIGLNKKVHRVLEKLAHYKHPLAVRQAGQLRNEVRPMAKDAKKGESVMIKDGSRTYFLDIEKMSDGKPYMKITESRFRGEGKDRERKDILIFP